MFWKKSEDVNTFSEHLETLPEVRCGDKYTHYTYYYNGAKCAKCSELEELDKEDRLARKIAEEVVKILKESENDI